MYQQTCEQKHYYNKKFAYCGVVGMLMVPCELNHAVVLCINVHVREQTYHYVE